LSALPIIYEIYKDFDFKHDVFILSKGHACAAWFAVLEQYGYKPDVTQRHSDIDIKNGISVTSGSLGHGLPLGLGMSLAKKIKKEKGTIFVLMGDLEQQEGTTWECHELMSGMDNLKVYVDYNEGQKEYPHVYRLSKEEYEKNTR
jgi:transketolase